MTDRVYLATCSNIQDNEMTEILNICIFDTNLLTSCHVLILYKSKNNKRIRLS